MGIKLNSISETSDYLDSSLKAFQQWKRVASFTTI